MPHLLKRLELNGFKSFATRTVLEFPAGITAIVGPNGSGKSNLVDAVRWLLGEREAKNLRGGKVEDLIFAGTPKRPRMGMAQAALHFENIDNFFPTGFSEVVVTRQTARDGASKYFLNKSEILLRDLLDLFAKVRLGSRGLIVVTQGNSDIFMRATPKERREMIEEILGLREYQLKKADAERRLKNSGINLEKVNALIEEILPHLRSLKRQTNRWEKRGELEEELRNLENAFFGSQLKDIKDRHAEIEKKISSGKSEFTVLEKEKSAAEEKQAKVEASQPKEREALKQIREKTKELMEEKNRLGKDMGRLEAQIEIAGKAASAPAQGVISLIKEIRKQLNFGLRGDMVEIRAAVESAIEMIDEILGGGGGNMPHVPSEKRIDPALDAQFKKIRDELAATEKNIKDLQEQERNLEKSQEDFYRTFRLAVAEVKTVKDKIENRGLKNRELLFERERIDLRMEELKKQIKRAGREENEPAFLRDGFEIHDSADAERRMFKLRGDLASIGEADEAVMKEARETEERYEFLKKESGDLGGAVHDLRQLIDELTEKITEEFEKALVKINSEFNEFFGLMFDGGQARLKIEQIANRPEPLRYGASKSQIASEDDAENMSGENEETEEQEEVGGVLIDLKLPRKKISSLEVLSGGEKSLVGIAALFALISVSPPPFLVLDEIDAALDDRNARRFAEMLKEFSKKTQFVIVTHNRATMEVADILYGVTLNEDGTSKVLSLKLEQN